MQPIKRPQEQGAALVIVMALLASSLMIGVIGVQSALVEERLASNYRASTLAQMRAEIAASEAVAAFGELEWDDSILSINSDQTLRWEDVVAHPLTVALDGDCEHNSCLYIPVERDGQPWVMALGVVIAADNTDGETLLAQSLPIFVRVKGEEESDETEATVVWH
ncbi:pilus assembly PilX family protein [Vreelandella zhaodongensis]|uniref:pilus assembly PilX family protein n=1 Tax=Vreelandella zhaodongensis TaxID=1176240 RepID=UPI003EBCE107